MSEKYPFQLHDYGHQIIEISVHEPDIKPDHKAIAALQLLNKKFDQIILSLDKTASLNPQLLPVLLKVSEFGGLKLVAPEVQQIPFDLHGIPVFKDVVSAIRCITSERNAEKILKQISRINLAKPTVYNLLQIMRNPEVKFEEIEEVTSKDTDLVMRMLKTANTVYFSRRIPVDTLKAAMTYLGLEGIRQLLVHELFNSFTQFFSNQRDRLIHMRRCSHLSAYIGKLIKADLPTIGKMRVAGLLHDLGSLVLAFYDSKKYSKVLSLIRRDHMHTYDAEMRVFGINHQYIGTLYAREMSMPDYIISTIEKHHDAEINKDDLVLMSVVCANGFLNEKIEQINPTVYDHLLTLLAAEINNKNSELQKLKKLAEKSSESDVSPLSVEDDNDLAGKDDKANLEMKSLERTAGESDLHAEIIAKTFKPMQFYGLLKEELDQFILLSAGTQGK